MSLFLVYDLATGNPKRHGICGDHDIGVQALSGEGVADISNLADWDGNESNWVWNGTAITKKVVDSQSQLAAAKAAQIASLQAAYQRALTAPVSYTTKAGTTATFAQDATTVSNLQDALLGSQASQTWSINLWLDVSGSPVSPFTFADLQGLAAAMESADTPKFTELLTLIAQVNAATTIAAVQAIIWS